MIALTLHAMSASPTRTPSRAPTMARPRKPPASAITDRDARALEWFFSEGQSAFHRSTFGAALERAQLYSARAHACGRCTGTGFTVEDGSCATCHGSGRVLRARRRQQGPITAQPVHSTHEHSAGYTPSDETLIRYAEVSSRLQRMPAWASATLATFHGDAGARWGATRFGRLLALYPMTTAGKKLLRASEAEENPNALSEHERIGTEAGNQATQPRKVRGDLLLAAREQAEQLYTAAAEQWRAVVIDRRRR